MGKFLNSAHFPQRRMVVPARPGFMRSVFLCFILATSLGAAAADLPVFASDAAADRWLRANSAYYRTMAAAVEGRTGYSFRTSKKLSGGVVTWEKGKPVIELGAALAGPERVSVLIFELTNCFQAPQHQEVDNEAGAGKIKTAREFGMLHEIVELDGLRHHRRVLEELDARLHGIPAEMFQWISSTPGLRKLDDYQLPYAFDYLKAQSANGHTQLYYEWFPRQVRNGTKKR
jgi:hypothetical protein